MARDQRERGIRSAVYGGVEWCRVVLLITANPEIPHDESRIPNYLYGFGGSFSGSSIEPGMPNCGNSLRIGYQAKSSGM